MNPCKNCLVDMICTKKCPLFEIDLQRLKTDEDIYLKRCMNNIKNETYQVSANVKVEICEQYIVRYKNNNIE